MENIKRKDIETLSRARANEWNLYFSHLISKGTNDLKYWKDMRKSIRAHILVLKDKAWEKKES